MVHDFFRGRRLRQSEQMRAFFAETAPVLRENLIMPYFAVETDDAGFEKEIPGPVPALPAQA